MSLEPVITGMLHTFVFTNPASPESAASSPTWIGTALHEEQGRIYIPKTVEFGFKALHDRGRPFVLEFPAIPPLWRCGERSAGVVRTSHSPIPTVTLNGSLLGYVTKVAGDEMAFEEIVAYPLTAEEIDAVLNAIEELIGGGLKNLLLFYYPRDWRMGEIVWTPSPSRCFP